MVSVANDLSFTQQRPDIHTAHIWLSISSLLNRASIILDIRANERWNGLKRNILCQRKLEVSMRVLSLSLLLGVFLFRHFFLHLSLKCCGNMFSNNNNKKRYRTCSFQRRYRSTPTNTPDIPSIYIFGFVYIHFVYCFCYFCDCFNVKVHMFYTHEQFRFVIRKRERERERSTMLSSFLLERVFVLLKRERIKFPLLIDKRLAA